MFVTPGSSVYRTEPLFADFLSWWRRGALHLQERFHTRVKELQSRYNAERLAELDPSPVRL